MQKRKAQQLNAGSHLWVTSKMFQSESWKCFSFLISLKSLLIILIFCLAEELCRKETKHRDGQTQVAQQLQTLQSSSLIAPGWQQHTPTVLPASCLYLTTSPTALKHWLNNHAHILFFWDLLISCFSFTFHTCPFCCLCSSITYSACTGKDFCTL